MANMLLQSLSQRLSNPNSMQSIANQLKKNGPSSALFNRMYATNPKFRQFADSMAGKTPEQAFSENGLDFNQFKNLKW